MEILYGCCCGLDVHKDSIKANLIRNGFEGMEDVNEIKSYGTTTGEILKMADWLRESRCSHVAMESTGVYWKPIFNILESEFEVILVNARHIKNVPGRKTDVKDCQWIAQLLRHGLLKPSFIPPTPVRELRDLTRQRKKLIQERASVANRIQKVLEDANIKLSSVASDVLGKSGWSMLESIAEGTSEADKLAELAIGRLRAKKQELRQALEGRVTDHHRFMLKQLMDQMRFMEKMIGSFDQRIEEHMASFFEQAPLMNAIPGIARRAIENIIAEIGPDMNQFPSDRHLSSWAGMCPGNNESAGKNKSGKTPHGNKWLKSILVECAWSASHAKNTYFAAQYRRIASRRGKKRALVAVGHTILVTIYHVLKNNTSFVELGNDYFDKLNSNRLERYYIKRLERLGYSVSLERNIA